MCCRFTTRPLLSVVIPLDEVELLNILGQPVKLAGCSPPQLVHFGGSLLVWDNLS